MNGKRQLIREYIDRFKWATARNISFLIYGTADKKHLMYSMVELNEMNHTKRVNILRKIPHPFGTVYATSNVKVGTKTFVHNNRLRDCLGKLIFERGNGWMALMELGTFSDAQTDTPFGKFYYEMDSGFQSPAELEKKLRRHYKGKGQFQVIFWMATKEQAHWRTMDSTLKLEASRVEALKEVARKVLFDKPNRVLVAGYQQYLKDGKLFNLKGEAV